MNDLAYQHLAMYFGKIWKSNLNQYTHSGWALINKIKPGEKVLDVGCGFNEFKKHIPNLVGIDPFNKNADIMVSIENFEFDEQFDVIFCLGAINFGSQHTIKNQIKKMVLHLKEGGRIYWRQNPGYKDHQSEECLKIDFYNWTLMDNYNFAFENNCKVEFTAMDCNRIYAEWTKCMS
jgi:cyclopropane fatty-acyl-phospholipid synthase-like methyltransferase